MKAWYSEIKSRPAGRSHDSANNDPLLDVDSEALGTYHERLATRLVLPLDTKYTLANQHVLPEKVLTAWEAASDAYETQSENGGLPRDDGNEWFY